MYQHLDEIGSVVDLPVGKVVCVGKNYRDHIEEMQSSTPSSPLLFMKPKAAMCALAEPLRIPTDRGECHNELELAILLRTPLCNASEDDVKSAVWGIGLGLDLTLRDVQRSLKEQGHPWERAKAFDFSCPLSQFIPKSRFADWDSIGFSLSVNGQRRQQGNSKDMLHAIVPLIAYMSSQFSLDAGDVILTGTPKGVGPLHAKDKLTAALDDKLSINTQVAG